MCGSRVMFQYIMVIARIEYLNPSYYPDILKDYHKKILYTLDYVS